MPTLDHFLGSQGRLMEAMSQLGFVSSGYIEKGLCYGVAHMGKQAMLAEDLETFNNRFERMYSGVMSDKDLDNLKYQMIDQKYLAYWYQSRPTQMGLNKYIDELYKQNVVIETDASFKVDSDLRAFFDGIEIYNFQFMHPELFDKKIPFRRDPNLSVNLTLPVQLEDKKIANVDSFSGMYTSKELNNYFASLKKTLEAENSFGHPVSLIFRNFHHTLQVGYCPKQKAWMMIDANNKFLKNRCLPITHAFTSIDELVNKVMSSFWSLNDLVTFSTEVYVTGDQAEVAKEYMLNWHQQQVMQVMHNVTPQKAKLLAKVDREKIEEDGWILAAAINGHTDTIAKLIAAKANLNLQVEGASALYLAAVNNHSDIVSLLLNAGANPNILTDVFANPLFPAVRNGNIEIVNSLLAKGANVHQIRKDKTTLLKLAIKHDEVEIISCLLKAGAKLTKAELEFAKAKGNVSVVDMLMEHASLFPPESPKASATSSSFGLFKKANNQNDQEIPDKSNVIEKQKLDDSETTLCSCAIM